MDENLNVPMQWAVTRQQLQIGTCADFDLTAFRIVLPAPTRLTRQIQVVGTFTVALLRNAAARPSFDH